MNTDRTESLFDIAVRRLYELGLDDRQIEFALYDWPQSDEHLNWLITAPRGAIIDWGEYTNWGREDA